MTIELSYQMCTGKGFSKNNLFLYATVCNNDKNKRPWYKQT